jgi:glycogen operon protein
VHDDSFLVLFNAHVDPVTFTLPGAPWGEQWVPVLDTSLDHGFHEDGAEHPSGAEHELVGLSLQVLRRA